MSQLAQNRQPPHHEKRDSILSHHSIPNLNNQPSTEPVQQDHQVPSFQFIESIPTTMMKSFKFTAGGENSTSMSIIPGDCDLKYYKSTTSSNGPLIREQDENQMSHRSQRVASLNLIGDAVSLNNIDDQKSTGKFVSGQKLFFPTNNEEYFPQDDQDDLRDSMCPSGGSRRLLSDQTPSERGAGDGKQKTQEGGFTKNYRQLNEEKENSGSYSDNNRGSTRYKEKIDLFPIEEDENGSPVNIRSNGNQTFQQANQTPNRRPTHGNSHRTRNDPQQIALNLYPDSIQNSPQSSLSPQFLIRREDSSMSPNSVIHPQIVNPWEAPVDREDVQVTLETKLYMKRMLAVYVTVSLFSLFLFLAVTIDMSFQIPFGIILCYFIYYGIENIVRTCYFQREIWRDTEDVYNTLDAFCGTIFLILAQLKESKFVSVSMISFIPFMATTGAYHMFSKAPRVVRNTKTSVRCFYTLQVFLITAKLDKVFDWDWRIIVGLTWICFGIIGIRSTILTVGRIFKLVGDKIRRRNRANTTLMVEFTGAIWKLLYYILYVVGFIALFGCSQAFLAREKRSGILQLSAIVSFGITAFLILYTLVTFKPLLKYLKKFQRFHTPSRQNQAPQLSKKPASTINLEVEKHKSYFVMLSPTYFLPLKNGFIAQKEENIKRIKKMLHSLRIWRSRKPQAGTVASPKPANIEELKQDKDVLDEKFTKLANLNVNDGEYTLKIPRATRARAPTSVFIEHFTGVHTKDKESLSTIGGDTGRKQNLSADDLHFNRLSIQKTGKAHSEENLCYLCFDNVPNAVLMGCGHGGICYDCASELVKKKNECMECRSSVEAIYKVDANLKVCDIIKGFELTKVCVNP